jgi:tetratricopeptide (TPR) repeat protein/beta-lactamase regulating signal transducer with metallopeptidase domain
MINIDLLSAGNTLWPGMANHLWQTTLFAAAAWLITLVMRKNRARIRYWIWFAVSIKFLIPFSLLVSLGGLIAPEWMKAPVEIPPELNVIHTIHQPFNLPDIKEASPSLYAIDTPYASAKIPVMLSFWLCGSLALLLTWHKRGMKVSRVVCKADLLTDGNAFKDFRRIKKKNRISGTVQLASTEDMMEPGVYGIFRPVLLLPAGILKHVNDSELEAILMHEFEHIRCKDNLTASIHMLVQALFWFHPVVWYAGSRLIYEREVACDETVLRCGKNPRAYAEGILKVCEYYFRSPLACLSGVIGSNLIKRVEGIMNNQTIDKLSMGKKLFLSMAGLSVLGIPLALGIMNAPTSQAGSLDNDPVGYKVDSSLISGRTETNNKPPEIINEKADQVDSGVISNTGTTPRTGSSDETDLENTNSPVVMANVSHQTPGDSKKKNESFEAGQKTVPGPLDKSSIVTGKVEDRVKDSSDSGIMGTQPGSKNAGVYISRGISCLKEGLIEDALSNLNRAIDLDPGNAAAYVARGSAYFRQGRFDSVISDCTRAIEINPDLAVAYQNRGSAYYRLGNLDNAVSDYSRAIELNPDLAAAFQDRGSIYQGQGRLKDAISDYSRALKINPDDAVTCNYRGSAYFKQGQYEKAFADFNRAIELNPKYVSAYINRGTYYYTTDDARSAVADYKMALDLNPENSFSKQLKDYIDYAEAREIECRRIRFRKVCLTKAQWASAEKTRQNMTGRGIVPLLSVRLQNQGASPVNGAEYVAVQRSRDAMNQ